MRWLRLGLGKREAPQDPGRQVAVLQEIRQRYGAHEQAAFAVQADAVARLLDGDDGLVVAASVLAEFTASANHELLVQAAELHRRTGQAFPVDRRNYRPLWRTAGAYLHWPLFVLPCGLHPYVHVAAAASVVGARARRAVKVLYPEPVAAQLFEVLDLTIAGWEFGRVPVDADAASLAGRLIGAGRDLLAAMDEPPRLPPPVRELMRRNHTVDVYDLTANRIVGAFNPGREMREALLA